MLTLYKPNLEDLWFRESMLEDEETMSYNHHWGGTISFPKENHQSWYNYWIINNENKRYYRYVKDDQDNFVGEIAYHYDKQYDGYVTNVLIHAKYRKQGYGTEALRLLCLIAKENGITTIYDDIAIDNPGISIFIKMGFIEKYRTEEIILLVKSL